MENKERIYIGEKEYSRDELLAFGKCHYPKFYWIPRGVGIGFMAVGFTAISLLVLFAAINHEFLSKSNTINWYLWVQIIAFACVGIGGLISYIVSFKKLPDENYIKHAVDYYTRLDRNTKAREARLERRKEKEDVTQLLKYKQLLDAGAITEEEYNNKKKEILGE